MNIVKMVEQLRAHPDRELALNRAEEIAKLTLPSLMPKGQGIGDDDMAYSNEGAQAVRNLASNTRRLLMPDTQGWFILTVQESIRQALLGAQGVNPAAVDQFITEGLTRGEKLIREYHGRQMVKSRISRAILRNLVEGLTGMRILRDRITIFPLNQVINYRTGGELEFWIAMEDVRTSAPEFSKKVETSGDREAPKLYTLVDVVNKEVWQQRSDQEQAGQVKALGETGGVDGGDARQWLLFSSEIPDRSHYPDGFCYNFITLFGELDYLLEQFGQAAHLAAWAVLCIHPASGINSQEVSGDGQSIPGWKSGDVKLCDPKLMAWITSAVKLADWSAVMTRIQDLRLDKNRIFGRLRELPAGEQTATYVLSLMQEIDEQTADLLGTYEETLQGPMVTASAVVTDVAFRAVNGTDPIMPVITTGASALQRQVRAGRMLQGMSIVQGLDPSLYNRREAHRILSKAEGFDEYDDQVLEPEITPEMLQAAMEQGREEGRQEASSTSSNGQAAPAGAVVPTAGGMQPVITGEARDAQTESTRGRPRIA